MERRGNVRMASALLLLLYIFATSSCIPAVDPQEVDSGGFWYGTQSLSCIGGSGVKSGLTLSISRRSIDPAAMPSRADLRYIHRLLYYRRRVFEWGSGARAYHVGPNASVASCPVCWEHHPAGRSNCSVESLVNWTTKYEHRYGGYNVLVNNCHQFANRAVAFLLSCPGTSPHTSPLETSYQQSANVEDGTDYGGPSAVMNGLWKLVQWLSYVLP